VILATAFGCSITGIELRAGFADEGRAQVSAAGLESLVEIYTADAREYPLEPEAWDAALSLGAAFVWGNIRDAARALLPTVKPGGFVAIGEPFWRRWPLPEGTDDEGTSTSLAQAIASPRRASRLPGSSPPTRTTGTDESLHWRALEEWLATTPVQQQEIRARHTDFRRDYLGGRRSLLGWAILVGRKS
jgi:hypothetical protein